MTEYDFERRLGRVLRIARKSLPLLISSAESSKRVSYEKVVSETAILLLLAGRSADQNPPLRTGLLHEVDALAAALEPYARSERILARVLLWPAFAHEFATAHACLSRLGRKDTKFDEGLAAACASSLSKTRERLPSQELELAWLKKVGGPTKIGPASAAKMTAAKTGLATGLDALLGNPTHIYRFTHTLMYLTDFGTSLPRFPRAKSDLEADAETALARCLDEDDLDLAGELLLTWPFLAKAWSPAALFGLRVLTRVEDRIGFLVARGNERGTASQDENDPEFLSLAAQNYHTVYVMGILCAVGLQQPVRRSPRRGTVAGSAAAFRVFLESRTAGPAWEKAFAELPPSKQDDLSGLLVTIALRRAFLSRDFRKVQAMLALTVAYKMAPTPATIQAAEFLSRASSSVLTRRVAV